MTIFKDAAKYYKHRVQYPIDLIELIRTKLNLDGTKNLLDIGAGDGHLSVPLSRYFKEVFAVDIDNEMLEEGKRNAEQLSIRNMHWICKSGEELTPIDFNQINVVSFANALHWFDQEKILRLVYSNLPEDGAVIIIGGTTIWREAPEIWQQKTLEVIKKYLGPDRLTINGKFNLPKFKFGEAAGVAGFKCIERQDFDFDERILNSDDIINLQFSTSYAAPELFKGRADEFALELKAELLKINPNDKFVEEDGGTIVIAWKN